MSQSVQDDNVDEEDVFGDGKNEVDLDHVKTTNEFWRNSIHDTCKFMREITSHIKATTKFIEHPQKKIELIKDKLIRNCLKDSKIIQENRGDFFRFILSGYQRNTYYSDRLNELLLIMDYSLFYGDNFHDIRLKKETNGMSLKRHQSRITIFLESCKRSCHCINYKDVVWKADYTKEWILDGDLVNPRKIQILPYGAVKLIKNYEDIFIIDQSEDESHASCTIDVVLFYFEKDNESDEQ